MADAKGRSGGKREGAGRKPRAPVCVVLSTDPDPVIFLTSMMQCNAIDLALRIVAAKALLLFKHTGSAAGGKKASQADATKVLGKGRFAPSAPPRLVVDKLIAP
jgi:hypothetical protein